MARAIETLADYLVTLSGSLSRFSESTQAGNVRTDCFNPAQTGVQVYLRPLTPNGSPQIPGLRSGQFVVNIYGPDFDTAYALAQTLFENFDRTQAFSYGAHRFHRCRHLENDIVEQGPLLPGGEQHGFYFTLEVLYSET